MITMLIIWNTRIIRRLVILFILFITITFIIYTFLLNTNNLPPSHFFKKASLTYRKKTFYLKDEPLQILSGAIHYFRVPPDSWRDKLKFLRSAGLNTVETYCPWNLHEERKGLFNFDGILNLRKFVQIAHELGLHVILRPGPYICAELEFGGLPSWLLSDPNMKVRSSYIGFMGPVEDYLRQVIHEIDDLQHSNGGPIIAFQLENEYGTFGTSISYMQAMKDSYIRSGVVEALFISNNFEGMNNQRKIEGLFYGINANSFSEIKKMVALTHSFDPELPIFISEFWTGWFQKWGAQKSQFISDDEFRLIIVEMLKKSYSFNLYMFHGGTNFGFINGASNDSSGPAYVTTSYDYNAPLSEDGRPTSKYFILRKALLNHLASDPNLKIAEIPENEIPFKYGDADMIYSLDMKSILDLVDNYVISHTVKTMEELPINGNSGQSFGFILYRTEVKPFTSIQINGYVRDRALIMYNGETVTKDWRHSIVLHNTADVHLNLSQSAILKANGTMNYLDIIVENMGRYNYGKFQTDSFNDQRKGILGKVLIDQMNINNWKIYPLEFKKPFMNKLSGSQKWETLDYNFKQRPQMYKGSFIVNDKPCNTHVMLNGWTKGVMFINGVNLGRYWHIGPTQSLFLPKSFLRMGDNEIIIFELHTAGRSVTFLSNPVFLNSDSSKFN